MLEVETPVVETTPPADSATATTPPAEKPEREAMIPRERFDEVNNSLKEEREARLALESRMSDFERQQEENKNQPNKEDEIDPDAPVTKKELKEWEEREKDKDFQKQIDNRHSELEKELDGKDGRPAYKKSEIVAFVRKNPEKATADPMDVYKLMNYDKLVDWKAEQKLKAQKPDNVEKPAPAPKKPDAPKSFKTAKEHDDYVRAKYNSSS